MYSSLADPKGGAAGVCPPNGIQFFRLCIRFHQKPPMSEVGVPPNGSAPPTENPGSATVHIYVVRRRGRLAPG